MNNLQGVHEITILNSDEEEIEYKITSISEKGKRPTISIHGLEDEADLFILLDDTAKKAAAEQGGKRELLIATTKEIRDLALSEDTDVPESVRYASKNGRSVVVTAKYLSRKLDDNTGIELKALLKAKEYEEVIQEQLTIKFPKDLKITQKLIRQCKTALKDIVDCEIEHTYKTKSGFETYQKVEEILDTAGEDVELIEALRPVRAEMAPSFDVKTSTKAALSKR